MKKIINRPETVVDEMCCGMVLAHPELALDRQYRIIHVKSPAHDKVSLISGGGSGHEPAHAGFVGQGLLDAAVCGDVFASPSQVQVYQAIRKTASKQGVLLIIKNYSGDMMNFTNAAHMAREDGIPVEFVKVDDDIAVRDSLYTVGRRGVAGTIFVHKIAGAAAAQGKSLMEVKAVAEKAVSRVRSMGFALTSCTVPAKGTPTFELGENELEYGVGIHGEPGIQREPLTSARELAGRMVSSLTDELGLSHPGGHSVALLINGFGATPLMELYLLCAEVTRELAERNLKVERTLVGNYMTSIDMAGASVSILSLDQELKELLDVPCNAPALKITGPVPTVCYQDICAASAHPSEQVSYAVETPGSEAVIHTKLTLGNIQYLVDVMSAVIIEHEVPFCELDSFAGDGDFGMSIAKGFRELKRQWKAICGQPDLNISSFLNACALVIMEHCGGASGPIWGSAFRAAARQAAGKVTLSVQDFADMLQAAVTGIQDVGRRSFGRGAVIGDKTLIDALAPCADAWSVAAKAGCTFQDCFQKGAAAAVLGAQKTSEIVARMGRAGTVGSRSLGHPDAGAYALGVIFTELAKAIQ